MHSRANRQEFIVVPLFLTVSELANVRMQTALGVARRQRFSRDVLPYFLIWDHTENVFWCGRCGYTNRQQ